MSFTRDIPVADLKPGDYFKAKYRSFKASRSALAGENEIRHVVNTCELVERNGPIITVKTSTRVRPFHINVSQIIGTGWGDRP